MSNATNRILALQNEAKQLDRLAAKTFTYAQAEAIEWLQAALPVINALVWPGILAAKPEATVWAAFCGLILPLADTAVLDPLQKHWKAQAAKIQEVFDCEVLDLEWNDLVAGPKPTPESVAEAAQHFSTLRGNTSQLPNWYPTCIAPLPNHLARIICQRSNCWWDGKLRRRFAFWVIGIVAVAVVFAVAIGLVFGVSLEGFVLAVLAPTAPALIWGLREFNRQRSTANDSDRTLQYATALWERACSQDLPPHMLQHCSRQLQDAIYWRRKSSPVNPSFLYSKVRSRYEHQMHKGAEELAREYSKRKGV